MTLYLEKVIMLQQIPKMYVIFLNKYFINTTQDMREPDHIDIEGSLGDILSAYLNHFSINEMKERHTVNDDEQFEFHSVTQVDIFKTLSSLSGIKACGYYS